MEDITDADFALAKRVCKDFKIRNIGEYHDLHVQSNTLLLADVFENLEICVLKYTTWPCKISFSSRISMASSFRKD